MDPRDTPSRLQHGVPLEPRSRREFLKAAVVGGTAVATGVATGAAGIMLSSNNGRSLPQILTSFAGGETGSGRKQFTMCCTSSSYVQTSSFNVDSKGHESNPGTLFVWLTAHNLPPSPSVGYILDITMDAISADPIASSKPFRMQSNGNNAFLYRADAWKANDCPTCSPDVPAPNCPTCSPGTLVRQANTEAGLYKSGAYAFGGSKNQDLQQYVHIVWDGGAITKSHTYTFSATVKDGNGNTLATLTSALSLTAIPK